MNFPTVTCNPESLTGLHIPEKLNDCHHGDLLEGREHHRVVSRHEIQVTTYYFGKWRDISLDGILRRMSPRTEKREFIAIPVRASGTDANGNPFRSPVCTLDLSQKGARITGLRDLTVGQILTLEYQNNKVRYEVVWTGQPGTPKAGQSGLRRIDTEKALADVKFDTAPFVDPWESRKTVQSGK